MQSPILNELKTALTAHYGDRLAGLVLFGSQARGDAAPGSDLDVLVLLRGVVEVEREIRETGPLVARISLAHDLVLSCVFSPEAAYRAENSPLMLNIRREGVPV